MTRLVTVHCFNNLTEMMKRDESVDCSWERRQVLSNGLAKFIGRMAFEVKQKGGG